jgi:regulator of nucleoside diphosphate kinase
MNVSTPATSIRTLNELDHVRIAKLLDSSNPAHAELLEVLDQADLVAPADIGADVVTMRSRVRLVDQPSGQARELAVVYPAEADAALGQVSVLSPYGAALLGRKIGEVAQLSLPDGRAVEVRVDAVLFQPEASGEFLR